MAVTTRLGLFKPAGTDLVDRIADLNNNLDLIDSKIGRVVCTSSTRPTGGNLYNGLPIYETDTGNYYTYDSGAAAWKPESTWTVATGRIAISANIEVGYGSSIIVTNASGDVNLVNAIITATGWATCYQFVLMNGDLSRTNAVYGAISLTFPVASGNVRAWTGNTAAVIASATNRYNWIAIGK